MGHVNTAFATSLEIIPAEPDPVSETKFFLFFNICSNICGNVLKNYLFNESLSLTARDLALTIFNDKTKIKNWYPLFKKKGSQLPETSETTVR